MAFGCWMAELLLLAAAATSQAQSGDGDADPEARISCTSHITTAESTLRCQLVGGRNEDDEDGDGDSVQMMTVCFSDPLLNQARCLQESGDTVTSDLLNPLGRFNVTVGLVRGGNITTTIDLTKIIQPRSPQVWNVSFDQESNQAVIRIRTPYHNEYLRVENQLFQLLLWSSSREMTWNSSSETVDLDMNRLQRNTRYCARVRAILSKSLRGSWSRWSDTYTFVTPAENVRGRNPRDESREIMLLLTVCLLSAAMLTSIVVFMWTNKTFTSMWPSIPHPKPMLAQICTPNEGLLLNFKPEEFSTLKIEPVEKTDEQPNDLGSVLSSACCGSSASVTTEELQRSAPLGGTCSCTDENLQCSGPPVDGWTAEAVPLQASPKEEAYVTMSSFYQIK
ncbi:interleukin-7 receptor subunit alpha isoform 1-T1 [Aulostomus maculatus]